jgi:AraC family transcriptional regulator of adaptative response/methylated-DNA-[protein]-cysteine methyltransferase
VASFYLWAYGNTLPRKQGEVVIRSLNWASLRNKRIAYSWHNTAYGRIIIASTAKGVCRVAFVEDKEEALDELRAEFRRCKLEEHTEESHRAVLKAISTGSWSNMVLYLQGTPFERKVWREVVKIPQGIRVSYADIAARTGYNKAFRAVGNAVGANPVAILIPCHRVIHADGTLGDYNAGADKKYFLLDAETSRN